MTLRSGIKGTYRPPTLTEYDADAVAARRDELATYPRNRLEAFGVKRQVAVDGVTDAAIIDGIVAAEYAEEGVKVPKPKVAPSVNEDHTSPVHKKSSKLKVKKSGALVTVLNTVIDHNGKERVLCEGTGEQDCWFLPEQLEKA